MQAMRVRWVGLVVLAILMGWTTPSIAQPNKRQMKVQHYYRKAGAAYQAKQWDSAIKYFGYLLRHVPYDAGSHYNLACCHALNGQKQEALDALADAVRYGWDDVMLMQADSDLALLRDDPRFARLMSDAMECHEEKFAAYRPDALDSATPAPLIVALHGQAGHPRQFMAEVRDAAESLEAALVAPRGPYALDRRGVREYGWQAPAESAQMIVKELTTVIESAIATARQDGPIDLERVVLVGYGQGGTAALLVAAAQPERFSHVVAFAAGGDQLQEVEWPAADVATLRVALFAGERDENKEVVVQAKDALAQAGHAVEFEEIPIIGKELPVDCSARTERAVHSILQGEN